MSLPDPKSLPRRPKEPPTPPPGNVSPRLAAAMAARKRTQTKPVEKLGLPVEVAGDPAKELAFWSEKAKIEIPQDRRQDISTNIGIGITERNRIRQLAIERVRRRNESLRLWEPMPTQKDFHNCTSYERVIIGSNRSGKTTCAAVDAAKVFSGTHENLSGIHLPKENGNAAVVGFDWDHIGRVSYAKLFSPGAFKIIRDEVTGRWRSYVPATDEHRKNESKDAPALIPKRLIKRIAWKSKGLGQPKLVVLKNGWKIHFYSSEGEPPQGDQYDFVWFDEEIQNSKWYSEIAMRLIDNDGYFVWSATPHVGGDDLIDLHNRAVEQLPRAVATTREFLLTLFGNSHLSEKSKARVVEKFKNNPEAYRVRVLGEFAVKAFKVYSEYSPSIHNFDPMVVWKKTGGQCPHDWCKYIAVDPGNTVCAVLFLAVPPPEYGEGYYVYKEIYIENCNVEKFSAAVEAETREATFEVFIMDMQAGQSRQITGGKSVEVQYHESLKCVGPDKINVWDRFKNHFFWPGSKDVEAGITEVKTCLYIDSIHGVPRLKLARNRLPNLEQEFDRYQYKKVDGKITNKPKDKWHHVLDCLRYLCGFRPTWQQPKAVPKRKSAAVRRFLEKKRGRLAAGDEGVINFGPGSTMVSV